MRRWRKMRELGRWKGMRNEEVKENRRIIEMEENEIKGVLGVRETRRWRKM